MKRNGILFIIVSLAVFCLSGCKDVGTTKVSATGSIYECLVVIPDGALTAEQLSLVAQNHIGEATGSAYDEQIATAYDLVKATMGAPMPCLPQIEPYFKVANVTPELFDEVLAPSRNILFVDINPDRYTQVKARATTDIWSHPQAFYQVQSPSMDEFVRFWLKNGKSVREWFVDQELSRQLAFYKAATNHEARQMLNATMGMDLWISEDYMFIDSLTLSGETNVLWFCNNKGASRTDLIVYSYPYTDQNTFTYDYLNAKRDEVLSMVVTASVPGSYMGTEYKVIPPEMRQIEPLKHDTAAKSQFYAMEVRGLWKILNGEAMGGPYVSHTRINPNSQRVTTAEVYVLAPGQKKRNILRKGEAQLYSWSWVEK